MEKSSSLSKCVVVCAILLFSVTRAAWADTSTLKCNSHKDLIWVYDSLTTLDVQAKLGCGESVEVLERVNDYVKIRAGNGVIGFVPQAAFSDLPAYQLHRDPALDVGYVAKNVQAKEIAKFTASNSAFANANGKLPGAAVQAPASKSQLGAASKRAAILPDPEFAEIRASDSPAPVKTPSVDSPVKAAPESATLSTSVGTSTVNNVVNNAASAGASTVAIPTLPHAEVSDASAENTSGYKLESESSDASCQSYFSAYGLTSNQLKWIAQNRKKEFPSVCPAPNASKVNYVLIFTHDVDFFSVTMPDPIHIANGFSDFKPMTTVDNALVSESDSDKAHREYVWVFQVGTTGFQPEKFSPHRPVQFKKIETNSLGSKAGAKVVQDAFRFVEGEVR